MGEYSSRAPQQTPSRTARLFVIASCILGATAAGADWNYGIGTGLVRLNTQGDQGLHTNIAGPVLFDVDLDPDDFADLMQSAIGAGGFATNGQWTVQGSFGILKLGGDAALALPEGTPLPNGSTLPTDVSIEADLGFDITQVEAVVSYLAYRHSSKRLVLSPLVGLRYLKHDISASLRVTAENVTDIDRGLDHSWTDIVIGGSATVVIAPKVLWNTRVDAGLGGTGGTLKATTAVSWRVHKRLSLSPNAFWMSLDIEEEERGDPEWYVYDAAEFGWGLSALVHF